jgi:PAS domain S-box-containing protein
MSDAIRIDPTRAHGPDAEPQAPIGLAEHVAELRRVNAELDEAHRAALTLMADAVQAREALDRLNAQLCESEARFKAMANTAPAMLWITEADGSCSFLSRGWQEFTGQTEAEALGFGWLNVTHPDDRARAESVFRRANAQREAFANDYRLRRADGEYRWVIDAGRPRCDEDGRFLGYIGSVIDVHERTQAEQSLRDADRRKDEFLATLAHELRNPLAPLRNSLQILRLGGADSGAAQGLLEMMERQVSQMVRMVDDLMEVSRITRGLIELRKESIDLATVIRSAVETSRPLIEANGHQLAISLPSDMIALEGDTVRLSQVFANLLNNAAKYTEPGGQIWLTARREAGEAVVSVRDNGIGLSAEMLPVVFDMFMQVDRSTDRAQGGLGIGLTLVKTLVELHGGTVAGHSDGPGQGSEFTVRLPVCAPESRAGQVPSTRPEAPELPKRRVLVVDDNHDAAVSLGMLLKILGSDVQLAHSGASALETIETYRPDVVLLDIGMPDMDGFEVARRIRANQRLSHVVLIALTGWGQAEDRHRTQSAGFDHHVVKPADVMTLQSLLGTVTN